MDDCSRCHSPYLRFSLYAKCVDEIPIRMAEVLNAWKIIRLENGQWTNPIKMC
jgi:hypothetical protein